jgi:predicted MFS family arabinose efflux permease
MSLQAVAFAVLAIPPTPVSLVIGAVLMATGGAVLYPTLVALVVERSVAAERGVALGTLSGAWDLGVVLGSAMVGLVADRISFGAGFAVGALGSALGVLALGVIESGHGRLPAARRSSP